MEYGCSWRYCHKYTVTDGPNDPRFNTHVLMPKTKQAELAAVDASVQLGNYGLTLQVDDCLNGSNNHTQT